jgi:hypothetical protein
MKPYTFRFYRRVTNSEGHPYDSTVEVISIRRAKTPERARQAAMRRFVRHHNLTEWDCLASGCEEVGAFRAVLRSDAAAKVSSQREL